MTTTVPDIKVLCATFRDINSLTQNCIWRQMGLISPGSCTVSLGPGIKTQCEASLWDWPGAVGHIPGGSTRKSHIHSYSLFWLNIC